MKPCRVRFAERGGVIDLAEIYNTDINRFEILTLEEEVELSRRIRQGDKEAENKLVRHNLRFVRSRALKFKRKYPNCRLGVEDLIQEASIGICVAARKFDGRRGIKFVGYAVYWIQQAMLQAKAKHDRLVRLPQEYVGDYSRIVKFSIAFFGEHGREPTNGEIAAGTGVSEEDVFLILLHSGTILSFETSIGESGRYNETRLGEVVPDRFSGLNQEQALEARGLLKLLSRNIRGLLKATHNLNDGERRRVIFILYYGLNKEDLGGETLENIGDRLGVTRERVRQVKEETWLRLRGYGLNLDEEGFCRELERLQLLEGLVGELFDPDNGPASYDWFDGLISVDSRFQTPTARRE